MKKIPMEIAHGLEQYLWADEIGELEVANDFYLSLTVSVNLQSEEHVLKFILSSLEEDHERWNSYSLVLSLGHIAFNSLTRVDSVTILSATMTMSVKKLLAHETPRILRNHLSRLLSVDLQSKLVRDISTHSLSRSLSESSNSTHVQALESSIVSSEFRICLNIIWICLTIAPEDTRDDEKSKLLSVLFQSLDTQSVAEIIPIRKVLLLIQKLLQEQNGFSDKRLHISPSNPLLLGGTTETSPLALLMHTFPLSVPKLSDFRSLVALSHHQQSLLECAISPTPVAIIEAIGIIDNYIADFVSEYKFHELEIEFMRSNLDFMNRTFRVVGRKKLIGKNFRKNLFNPKIDSRMSIFEFTKHMMGNYQIHQHSQILPSSAAESSSSESSSFLPLVNKALLSMQEWYGDENRDELIEAIADAAVPDPPIMHLEEPEGPIDDSVELPPPKTVTDSVIISLLKILLSSCRGSSSEMQATSPNHQGTLDLDRDHLVTMMEKFECPTHSNLERRKNFEIISLAICGIFQIIFCVPNNRSDAIFISNNGCLVLLKLITNAPEDGLDLVGSGGCIFPFLSDRGVSYMNGIPPTSATTLYRAMKVLYALCHNNPSRIKKFLIHYKLSVILKRFFKVPNYSIQKISFKLLKCQMRYLNKKWKMMHTRLISNCYAVTSTNVLDDWLTNDPEIVSGGSTFDPENTHENVLNDSVISPPLVAVSVDTHEEYIHALESLDFMNSIEVEKFSKKFNVDDFFCGSKNFDDFVYRSIGV